MDRVDESWQTVLYSTKWLSWSSEFKLYGAISCFMHTAIKHLNLNNSKPLTFTILYSIILEILLTNYMVHKDSSQSIRTVRAKQHNTVLKRISLFTGSCRMQKHAHSSTVIMPAWTESHLLSWDRSGKSTTFLFLSFGLVKTKEVKKSGLKWATITDSSRSVKCLLGANKILLLWGKKATRV